MERKFASISSLEVDFSVKQSDLAKVGRGKDEVDGQSELKFLVLMLLLF